MATFCSPKECVDYLFAVYLLAVKQKSSGINSSRSAPFPGRCQKSDCWGAIGELASQSPMHLRVGVGLTLANLWPEDGQVVDEV